MRLVKVERDYIEPLMRQLIPRLLRQLKARSITREKIRPLRPPAKGAKSLCRPLPPPPVFFGRSRSILLDEVNPITQPKAYRQHKSLPPQIRLPDSQKTRTISRDGTVEDDVRREMTAEEREWWANPYRMSFLYFSLGVRRRQQRWQFECYRRLYGDVLSPHGTSQVVCHARFMLWRELTFS
jgi:hypothetical protein